MTRKWVLMKARDGQLMALSQSFLATGFGQKENYPSGSRVVPVYLGAHLEINGPVRLFIMQ